MRTERLLAIVTYLMNRKRATCSQLAGEFEVSERTIQRDIESINLAGIPVVSDRGVRGGYRILDTFGFSRQPAGGADLSLVRQALESLHSALGDRRISGALEKVRSIQGEDRDDAVRIDFSISRERRVQRDAVELLRRAIADRGAVEFRYTGGTGKESLRTVEPVGLEFRWYAWYMAGYDRARRDYRIFKLVRMERIARAKAFSGIVHSRPGELFDSLLARDDRKITEIAFTCSRSSLHVIREYLAVDARELEEREGGEYGGTAFIIEDERLWFAVILSLGDGIKIISPDHIRNRIVEHSRKILDSYD